MRRTIYMATDLLPITRSGIVLDACNGMAIELDDVHENGLQVPPPAPIPSKPYPPGPRGSRVSTPARVWRWCPLLC